MSLLIKTWEFMLTHYAEFWDKTATHLQLSGWALLIGIAVGIALGVVAARSRAASPIVTNVIGAIRSVPSLAIMAVMLPIIGTGFRPALVALTILAIPPVLINTQTGFTQVSPGVLEAARGMGLGSWQIVWQVQLPLALPLMIAGIRTAAVEVLASATIGAIIGAGGLGEYVFSGLELGPSFLYLMLVGALTIALLTLSAELALNALEAAARRKYYR
jgi:osmoprotectant transport system permease protein